MANRTALAVMLFLAACNNADAATLTSSKVNSAATVSVNPIRKVVNMIKAIEKKVHEEIAAKEKLYDEYMCYCKTSDGTLATSIADGKEKIPQVAAKIEEDTAKKNQTEIALKEAQGGREAAKQQIAEAEKLRASGAETFDKASNDLKTNIAALEKAIPLIEKGMAGAFLQTSGAATLQRISVSNIDISPADRDLLTSFLTTSGQNGYAPQSGEIVGILKQIKDEMEKELADLMADEEKAAANYEELVAAKKKEIAALTKSIETKLTLVGKLGVAVAEAETDLENTKEALAEDEKFLADLQKNCDTKTSEWEEFKKMSNMELVALTETVKILNDDDALEIFKKTLPAAGSSFMQVQTSTKAMFHRALEGLKLQKSSDPRVDFIQMALHGGQMGFEKIIKMIDELMATLKSEQAADDKKKAYCLEEFDVSEDKKKALERDMSDLKKSIAIGEDAMSTLESEIAALAKQVKELDEQVGEATKTRKEEHEVFVETLTENKAAGEILAFALNRLYKFYKPNLYIAPPKVELAEFAQIHAHDSVAPPPPPEADMAYKKKEGASNSVCAMIEILIKDLEKDNLILEGEEKGAQSMYEKYMADAAEKRAELSQISVDKEKFLAETEADTLADKETLKGKETETMETVKYMSELHGECDWLLKYHEARAAARLGEVESLDKAKAVLSGADYSLIQMAPASHLRGSHHA